MAANFDFLSRLDGAPGTPAWLINGIQKQNKFALNAWYLQYKENDSDFETGHFQLTTQHTINNRKNYILRISLYVNDLHKYVNI